MYMDKNICMLTWNILFLEKPKDPCTLFDSHTIVSVSSHSCCSLCSQIFTRGKSLEHFLRWISHVIWLCSLWPLRKVGRKTGKMTLNWYGDVLLPVPDGNHYYMQITVSSLCLYLMIFVNFCHHGNSQNTNEVFEKKL